MIEITSNVITTIIILSICTILFIRHTLNRNKTISDRIVGYRDPLVPEEFYKVCRLTQERQGTPTIVWIVRHYLPDYRTEAEYTAHDINLYLIKIGWKVIVIVPNSSSDSYEGVPIYQFHQKTEIELAIQGAYCIFTQYHVLETAANTSLRSRKPLVVVAHDDTLGPSIDKIKTIHNGKNIYLVNNSKLIETVYEKYGLPSILLNPPVNWRKYMTHTTREYITMINMDEQFIKIAKALPEYKFLGICNTKQFERSLPNLTIWDSQLDARAIYSITGILCVSSKSEAWRVPIEAASSGIPVIGRPTEGLKETLETAGLYADETEWVKIIRELKENPLFYKKYSEGSRERAKELDPVRQLDEFQKWVQELVWV